MFDTKTLYKITTNTNNFTYLYTGYIVEETEDFIKIITIANEDVIINKDNIMKAVGVKDGERRTC